MAIPYYQQQSFWTCGPACLRMVLAALGIKKSEQQLTKILKTNRLHGTPESAMPKVAKQCQLNYQVGRNSTLKELQQLLKQGYFVIVSYYIPEEKTGHFSVVRKITPTKIHFLDPWYGEEHQLTKKKFLKVWINNPQRSREKRWFLAIRKN